jgi:hypothetical protein
MTITPIIRLGCVAMIGAAVVWQASRAMVSMTRLGDHGWQVVDPQLVLRHPALVTLWPHIRVEDAVASGFQDKRYRFRFQFNRTDGARIVALLNAAGVKHILSRTSDPSLPPWWGISATQPRCMWATDEAPAKPIIQIIGSCDLGTVGTTFLGQIIEF